MIQKRKWNESSVYIKECNEKKLTILSTLLSLKSSFITVLLTTVLTTAFFLSLSGCSTLQSPSSDTPTLSANNISNTTIITTQNTGSFTATKQQLFTKNQSSKINWNKSTVSETTIDNFNSITLSEPGKYKISYKVTLDFNLNYKDVIIVCNHYDEENELITTLHTDSASYENTLEKTITTTKENTSIGIQINSGYVYLIPGENNSFFKVEKI